MSLQNRKNQEVAEDAMLCKNRKGLFCSKTGCMGPLKSRLLFRKNMAGCAFGV